MHVQNSIVFFFFLFATTVKNAAQLLAATLLLPLATAKLLLASGLTAALHGRVEGDRLQARWKPERKACTMFVDKV